ncbi:GTPase family protein [Geomicrobium sp. JCM 19038]|uniref:GTPase family protein n=1 Tax=Geomicrobium sp. JCM 19038 TaxID=1460635 RepID=UPI0005A69DF3|nr:GTPase [Geomicrobium sp. JCM 19038]
MSNERKPEELQQSLELIRNKLLPKLPASVKQKINPEVEKLEELFLNTRSPRFAVVGRRGAGKSTLINAIFQKEVAKVGSVVAETERASWHTFKDDKNETLMEVLDTRGFGEGSSERFALSEEDAWQEAIQDTYPDAILFLVKAKEVDSRITEDIKQLKSLQSLILEKHDYRPPIVGVVTQVDELDPIYDSDPPFTTEKNDAIHLAVSHVNKMLKKEFQDIPKVIPVCAYLAFKNGEIVYDRRYNIETLTDYLLDQLPGNTWMEWARITQGKKIQTRIAKTVGKSASTIAAGVGAQPIPLADLPIITSIQISMVAAIAYISGRKFNRKTLFEFFTAMGANVGTALAFRQLSRSVSKFVFPVAGNAISGTLAATATWGLCKAAILYFIEKRPAIEAKEAYDFNQEKPLD